MNRDTVTGTYARTALMERLEEEVQRGLRYGDEFSLLVLDLDHFKSVNDAFGHSRGDAVLAELAARVQAAARGSDVLFRYGGDEFVLLLPRTSREQAAALGRRLADGIAGAPFAGAPPLSLGVSVGAAAFPEDGSTATALFDRADARMFQAKRGGGRVVAQDVPQRLTGALEGTGRLVERADALEHVNRFLDALARARRGVLHLSGPPGSGRSRLLREAEHLATLRGHRVLAVRGTPEGRAEPLHALRAACPGLDVAALRPGSPASVAALVRRAAAPPRGTALVVTVDDVGDVDRATLQALRALAAGGGSGARVAVVHTAGAGDPEPALPDVPLRDSTVLHPLSREGVRVWLRAALQAEPGVDLVDWLHAESGGLPGTVHALLLRLAERGALSPGTDGAWTVQGDFRAVVGGAPAAPPRLRNIPVPAGPLVDRDEALREVLRTLRAARLVTLCGPRGLGKTRLALEAVQEAAGAFADGVAWVDAGDAPEPCALATDVAAVLDARLAAAGADPFVPLVNALQPLRLLLVVDGMNDAAACGPLLRQLLEGAPGVRVLVTGRQRLQLAGEWAIPVEGLSAPRAAEPERLTEYDAVRLFAARAAALHEPAGEGDLPHVGRLVHALYGLPLAVAVAAAQTGTLSCREIANEVQGALDDLKAYLPAEPPERRIARAVLDVAWRILPAGLRAALRRVSLFHAPFKAQAALRVAHAGAAELDELARRGLLEPAGDGRWRLHGLVRDYAAAKLDDFPREREEASEAYLEHYLARLGTEAPPGDAEDPREAEMPDLRRVWDIAAREGRSAALADAADAMLGLLARRGGWTEAEMRFSAAVSWARAQGGAGDAMRRLEARLGAARVALDRPRDAGPLLRRSLAAAQRAGDPGEEAACLAWLARAHVADGEPRLARGAAAGALGAADRSGSPALRVRALCAAGESAWADGAYREAVECLYEAVEVDPDGAAAREAWNQLVELGEGLFHAGELALAAVLLSRAASTPGTPTACGSRARALLEDIRAREGSGGPSIPALVIVSASDRAAGVPVEPRATPARAASEA